MKGLKNYFSIIAVPWCCILPIGVALFGLAGGALGTFLSKLTPYFLVISITLIGYSNYNVWFGDFKTLKHGIYVTIITLIAIILWTWSIVYRMRWFG